MVVPSNARILLTKLSVSIYLAIILYLRNTIHNSNSKNKIEVEGCSITSQFSNLSEYGHLLKLSVREWNDTYT